MTDKQMMTTTTKAQPLLKYGRLEKLRIDKPIKQFNQSGQTWQKTVCAMEKWVNMVCTLDRVQFNNRNWFQYRFSFEKLLAFINIKPKPVLAKLRDHA